LKKYEFFELGKILATQYISEGWANDFTFGFCARWQRSEVVSWSACWL